MYPFGFGELTVDQMPCILYRWFVDGYGDMLQKCRREEGFDCGKNKSGLV